MGKPQLGTVRGLASDLSQNLGGWQIRVVVGIDCREVMAHRVGALQNGLACQDMARCLQKQTLPHWFGQLGCEIGEASRECVSCRRALAGKDACTG